MIYTFYFSDGAGPKTGLSPTLDIFVKVSDGTSAGTPPTPTELSGGFYKFTYTATEDIAIRIDSNDATMAGVDRYISMVASAHDDDLDQAVSTVYDRIGAPAGASISADLLVIDNFVDDLEGRCTEIRLAELDAANLITDVANVKAETALIVADTNELQTNQGNWLTAVGFSVPNEYDVVIAALQADLDNPAQYKADVSALATAIELAKVSKKVDRNFVVKL